MIKEHCGVFGVKGENAVRYVYEGLKLLQHRGQESAGISFVENGRLKTVKGLGLVEEALGEGIDSNSNVGIGHVRYSTTGKTTLEEAQPLSNEVLAVAFNGTITNYFEFGNFSTDTEFILKFLNKDLEDGKSLVQTIKHFVDVADGAYSLLVLTRSGEIYSVRDPKGFRPLVLGRIGKSVVVSSEDSPIRQLGGKVIRDVYPGEVVVIKEGEVYSEVLARSEVSTCAFEYIYFSRADSVIDGISVYKARERLGEVLFERHPVDADIVVPVPDSSRPIAIGFSRRGGIPLEEALVRTLASKRSFIMPTNEKRNEVLEEKFGVVEEVINGKRVVLIDDSIVRGNTMKRLISLLRNAGAKEVHLRIGSPPIRYPCYMGIDFPRRSELVAYGKTEEDIARELEADSLGYLTVEEMIEAIGKNALCTACFTGKYPLKGKYQMERLEIAFRR
ncbi:MAG: amidophosphoribosyltransferase [Candidatus Aramenus sulfurataquae]|uniref:Amidophosphoribosyltransferase n=2 Tax=Candidatus Aramenus sulfurataquae TaxID=1326980 RepID=W7KZ53_9CREN|nr:MAG: amidophosphoribosyltransferase [Candidatus Aramenus sulfurataquae]MCL7343085.1 amidophosphoribosyltransferase [Candidatus Aramenus sulfurataquae]